MQGCRRYQHSVPELFPSSSRLTLPLRAQGVSAAVPGPPPPSTAFHEEEEQVAGPAAATVKHRQSLQPGDAVSVASCSFTAFLGISVDPGSGKLCGFPQFHALQA
eukprot:CAMPEP_0117684792 /NCGR_PEP_ID=MMETSP0804-20121206/21330_1 /TAXON_ID=1074897 /ORGANISM="Tetraselmis astigmatica, Strain CCMP880" /LENGTH=104 /DNA_ID=CAMNT_0005495891 /DNA_START=206 /DNA_END=517 /DNA_ORIENTATION=+